ncbi:MAG: Trm112 family protein [Alphaproteobacteria bacterium]|nr:Trm112 family protein [Alphaproteobacteria bacterium]
MPDSRADRKLLDMLVCPVTRAPLDYDAARQELISRQAQLAYPIREGVPIMLPEAARRLEDDAAP